MAAAGTGPRADTTWSDGPIARSFGCEEEPGSTEPKSAQRYLFLIWLSWSVLGAWNGLLPV